MSLALSTLIYEWRRYLAAVVALAFSGLLVLATTGLFTGIVHSALATTERSRADLFILPPKATSIVNQNSSLPARIKPLIYLNPQVVEVGDMEEGFGAWVNVTQGGSRQVKQRVQKFVQIWSVDPRPGAVNLPVDFPESIRIALLEPGAIVADASALKQLGVGLGDTASLNGHTVKVRGVLHNYQDVDQLQVVTSRDTLRLLGMGPDDTTTGALMVKIQDPAQANAVRDQLNAASDGAYRAWTRAELSAADEKAVMGEQIVGVLLGFFVVLSVLIGVGITSQTLRGAILSNIREFASLRALGISMGSLRLIIVELSFWVGLAGLGATALFTWLVGLAADAVGLPLVLRSTPIAEVSVMLMVISIASGVLALGILKKSQPADLLR